MRGSVARSLGRCQPRYQLLALYHCRGVAGASDAEDGASPAPDAGSGAGSDSVAGRSRRAGGASVCTVVVHSSSANGASGASSGGGIAAGVARGACSDPTAASSRPELESEGKTAMRISSDTYCVYTDTTTRFLRGNQDTFSLCCLYLLHFQSLVAVSAQAPQLLVRFRRFWKLTSNKSIGYE